MPGLVESPNRAALRSPFSPFQGMSLPKTMGMFFGSGSGCAVLGGPWFSNCAWVSHQAGVADRADRSAAARIRRMRVSLARRTHVLAVLVHALGDVGAGAGQD